MLACKIMFPITAVEEEIPEQKKNIRQPFSSSDIIRMEIQQTVRQSIIILGAQLHQYLSTHSLWCFQDHATTGDKVSYCYSSSNLTKLKLLPCNTGPSAGGVGGVRTNRPHPSEGPVGRGRCRPLQNKFSRHNL